MRLLTNFPFEMFGPRESFPFERIVTFGPPEGRKVGPETFRYDIGFEPACGEYETLLRSLPEGFEPDLVWIWWPDQEPLPRGLERAGIPVVGTLSDYNLTLPSLTGLWPFFDLMLCDRPGLQILGRLPFARVEPWCQFSFRPEAHRIHVDASGNPQPRDIDLCFAGNLNPVIQRERAPWIDRLRAFEGDWSVFLGMTPQGEAYGRLLARSRIVFNRSVRGEINLRCFEAAACGALLFMERENLEVRDYFVPGEECILYGPEDLEDLLDHYLRHEEERARIAENGRRKARSLTLAAHCRKILPLLSSLDPSRRPDCDAARLALGRAKARLTGRSLPADVIGELEEAHRLAPEDPRICNDLAVAWIHHHPEGADPNRWVSLLERASLLSPSYLPPRLNLAYLARELGDASALSGLGRQIEAILERRPEIPDFDGLVLPLGFNSHQCTFAAAYCDALRRCDPSSLEFWARETARAGEGLGPSPAFRPASPAFRGLPRLRVPPPGPAPCLSGT